MWINASLWFCHENLKASLLCSFTSRCRRYLMTEIFNLRLEESLLFVSKFILNQSANKLIRCMILLTFHNCIILYLFKDESFDHFPKQSQRVSRKKVFQLRAHFQFMLTQKVFALFHRTFHILFKFCELFVLSKMQHTSNSFLLVPHSDFITSIVELFFPSALVYILIRNMCEIAKMLFHFTFPRCTDQHKLCYTESCTSYHRMFVLHFQFPKVGLERNRTRWEKISVIKSIFLRNFSLGNIFIYCLLISMRAGIFQLILSPMEFAPHISPVEVSHISLFASGIG